MIRLQTAECQNELGPEKCRPSAALPGYQVRISNDIIKAVAFIGVGDGNNFRPFGTGFFLKYDNTDYFVTAKHVAIGLGEDPFSIRVSKRSGGVDHISCDPMEGFQWSFCECQSVDLAACEIPDGINQEHDILSIPPDFLQVGRNEGPGIGDECYSVGLFSPAYGKQRNMPITHVGHLAMLPEDEFVDVEDRDSASGTRSIKAYLVEQPSLRGLSGSPVFYRTSFAMNCFFEGKPSWMISHLRDLKLLGVWQGSWTAPPDGLVSLDKPGATVVPVGIGVVVPASDLMRVLQSEALAQRRQIRQFVREIWRPLPSPD